MLTSANGAAILSTTSMKSDVLPILSRSMTFPASALETPSPRSFTASLSCMILYQPRTSGLGIGILTWIDCPTVRLTCKCFRLSTLRINHQCLYTLHCCIPTSTCVEPSSTSHRLEDNWAYGFRVKSFSLFVCCRWILMLIRDKDEIYLNAAA